MNILIQDYRPGPAYLPYGFEALLVDRRGAVLGRFWERYDVLSLRLTAVDRWGALEVVDLTETTTTTNEE